MWIRDLQVVAWRKRLAVTSWDSTIGTTEVLPSCATLPKAYTPCTPTVSPMGTLLT
jgi:hypothetical protein